MKNIFKDSFKDFKNIWDNHYLYVLCSIVYCLIGGFMFGGTVYSYIVSFVVWILSIILSLSPVAERLLRFLMGLGVWKPTRKPNI